MGSGRRRSKGGGVEVEREGQQSSAVPQATEQLEVVPATPAKKRERKKSSKRTLKPGNVPWSPIVTGKAGRVPIVFTRDNEFFFVASGSTIRIYSTNSGRLVSTLSSTSSDGSNGTTSSSISQHTATITGLAINPANAAQLISCSLDGTIKVWDFFDGNLMNTISLALPITHMATHDSLKNEVIVAARKPRGEGEKNGKSDKHSGSDNAILFKVNLRYNDRSNMKKSERLGKRSTISDMAISPDGRYLVLVGHYKIHVADLSTSDHNMVKVLTQQALTRVTFHPSNNTFATGHAAGHIRLWYFLASDDEHLFSKMASDNSKKETIAPSTLLHWHSHAVSALRFNDNGAYLLSGGEESTLVLWQLSTQGREYVPRLGGSSILSIATLKGGKDNDRPDQFITAMEDGSVVFISTVNLKPIRILQGVLAGSSHQLRKTIASAKRLQSLPLAVEPRTNNLTLSSGHPSTIQFLNTITDDQVMQLEIVPSNRVSRPGKDPLTQSHVEHICFSHDNVWMATVDVKATGETHLKIWQWSQNANTYVLNTRVDEPHGLDNEVLAMSFSPQSYGLTKRGPRGTLQDAPLLVTLGSKQGKCRSWKCTSREVKRKVETYWYARSIFDHRGLPAEAMAWSADGSLLAIVHGASITVWEPDSNALVHVFALPGISDEIPSTGKQACISFAGKGGRYIASLVGGQLTFFDVVLGQMKESFAIEEPVKGLFALDSQKEEGDLAVITSNAQKAQVRVYSFELARKVTLTKFDSLPFGIRQVIEADSKYNNGLFALFALTTSFDVVRIGRELESLRRKEQKANALRKINVRRRTIFDELLGKQQDAVNTIAPQQKEVETSRASDASTLFDMPSHLLPPPHLLFEPFMKFMLPARKEEDDESDVEEADSEMEEVEIDGDITAPVSVAQPTNTASRLARLAEFNMDGVTEAFARMGTKTESNGTSTIKVNGHKKSNGELTPAPHPSPRKEKAKKGRSSNAADVSLTSNTGSSPLDLSKRKRKNSNT
ncbi:WD40 repeat-like protein [Meira miltonrushii]|uniref:WD40 repeat-like protein n=1 Tax=Meira miltonrushii TaxID=1280837 RepID=A0A316V9Q4_9BASI|nr:WD40 repeat-like protein [Meira miltonrushii]PWN33181.1 WD40 repeat-like protein [Meira miltonrushii]